MSTPHTFFQKMHIAKIKILKDTVSTLFFTINDLVILLYLCNDDLVILL